MNDKVCVRRDHSLPKLKSLNRRSSNSNCEMSASLGDLVLFLGLFGIPIIIF